METPSLRLGDVPFADGNAAARTFGRAHRHRPYHFSCGSFHKVAGEVLADGLNRKKVAGEVLADGLNQEKVAGEVLADGQKQEMVAG